VGSGPFGRRIVLLLLGIALAIAVVPAASGQRTRPGVRVRYAWIDGDAGEQGLAFLLFSSRDVSIRRSGAPPQCGGRRATVRATARLPRGSVRSVSLALFLAGGEPVLPVTIDGSDPCRSAAIETRLADGTVLREGRYRLTIEECELRPEGRVRGRFTQTVVQQGRPINLSGSFHIPFRRR